VMVVEAQDVGLVVGLERLAGREVERWQELLAQVEIDTTAPARVVAVITREAAEELGLRPGMPVTALVKATSVMVER